MQGSDAVREKRTFLPHSILSLFRETDNPDYDFARAAIVRITCVAWLITLAISWRAYIPGSRIFSFSPIIDILAVVPAWADWALLALNAGGLGWLIIKPLQRAPAAAVLACTLFWTLQDLVRFQPYTYMYFFTLLLVVFWEAPGLNALRIMIGGVYFWAGFHKLNLTFCFGIFPRFISPFYKFPEGHSLAKSLSIVGIGCAVALFESLIGFFLLFTPELKRVATVMAFAMLVVVLACLGPTGRNLTAIVWPWNIYLFLLEVILFYRPSARIAAVRWQRDAPVIAATALFLVAPGFAIPGWWPSYPAFKLFSGNIETAQVVLAEDENASRLPENLGDLVDAERQLPVIFWTLRDFEMVVYSSPYVFRTGAQGLCPYLADPSKAKLRIFEPPPFDSIKTTPTDFPLCPEDSK